MNELQIFKNAQFGEIRTVTIDTEPWFVAVDVCKALEINPNATRRLEDDEKAALRLTQTSSNGVTQERDVIAVNEPGLYSLVLGSRKPEAKAFKRWITHDVIPAIRRTGGYIAGEERMNDDELIAQALLVAQRKLEERTAQLNAANARLEAAQAKADYYDAVAEMSGLTSFRETANLLGERQSDFIRFIETKKLCYRDSHSRLMPYAEYIKRGYFEVKEVIYSGSKTSVYAKITPTGRQYIFGLLRKERI